MISNIGSLGKSYYKAGLIHIIYVFAIRAFCLKVQHIQQKRDKQTNKEKINK